MEIFTQIWDLIENEPDKVRDSYFKGSTGIILMYDVNNRESFNNLDRWLDILSSKYDVNALEGIAIVGNKIELDVKVTDQDIQQSIDKWKDKFDVPFYTYRTSCASPNSAKLTPEDIFSNFIKAIVKTMLLQEDSSNNSKIIMKINLMGDDGVGKSSFKRLVTGEGFKQSYSMTIGSDFSTKSIQLSDDEISNIKEEIEFEGSVDVDDEIHKEVQEKQKEKTTQMKSKPKTRNIGVTYYDRLNPRKIFKLIVKLSTSEIEDFKKEEDFVMNTRKVQKKDKYNFEQDLITIAPVWPGCIVSPQERAIDLKSDNHEVEFSITPLVNGEIDGKVEFKDIHNTVLHIIETPAISRETKIAKTISYSGTVFGVTPPAIESLFGIEINSFLQNRLQQQIPTLANIFGTFNWLLFLEIIIVIGSILVGIFLMKKLSPRRNNIEDEVDNL